MRSDNKTSIFSILAIISVCGALAALAYELSPKWKSVTATQTSSGAGIESPSKAAAAASNSAGGNEARAREHHKASPTKVIGTIANVDAPNHRFILKTPAGTSESFRLAKGSVVLRHRRKLAFSALKAGESVIVQRRSGSNSAVRVYVLGDNKS